MRHRILATKIISVAHLGRAPQKVQLSVVHPESCATEIARQDPYAEEFCGALSLMRHRKWCATKKNKSAPQKYETEIHVFFHFAVQIQVYTGFIQVYTEIQVYLTGI